MKAALESDKTKVHSQQIKMIGHNSAGTATIIDNTSQYLAESTTGVQSLLDVSAQLARVRLVGNTSETYDWRIRIRAQTS